MRGVSVGLGFPRFADEALKWVAKWMRRRSSGRKFLMLSNYFFFNLTNLWIGSGNEGLFRISLLSAL